MLFVAALLTHSVASAQTAPTDAPTGHNLYLSAALGFNSPSGFVGVEADFRINPLLTVGLGTGIGLWGHRISPMVKLDYATTRHSTVFRQSGQYRQNGER